jgi:hypothetical protein
MYREPQQSVETSDTKYAESDGDLQINNLVYEMPRSLSLATGRTFVNQFPQRQSYDLNRNSTIIFDLNTGNSFIDSSNSYLRFKLKAYNVKNGLQDNACPTFGVGSSLNLIHEYRIRSRSGVELDRVENCNLYNSARIAYTKTTNWTQTIGSSFFSNSSSNLLFNGANTFTPEICIPLKEVANFFCPLKGQLIPPQIASGLRIELSLESVVKSFLDPNGYLQEATSRVELYDIALVLDTVSLSDETSKLLNLESSQSGLEYTFPRVYNYSSTFPAGSTTANIQCSKAVSQATQAFVISQGSTNVQNFQVDSFLSEQFAAKTFQMRLGSAYYPNQAVVNQTATTSGSIRGMETYLMTMSAFEKMKMPYQETSITPLAYSTNRAILAVDFQRNQSLQISGLPINNSRTLEILLERDPAFDAGQSRDINVFLTYISVAKAYIDNLSVSI